MAFEKGGTYVLHCFYRGLPKPISGTFTCKGFYPISHTHVFIVHRGTYDASIFIGRFILGAYSSRQADQPKLDQERDIKGDVCCPLKIPISWVFMINLIVVGEK